MSAEQSSRVRVRYAETDKMGVMHHAVWAVYWELGRTNLMRERGKSYAEIESEHGIMMPVISFGVELLSPARYDDEIEIRTRLVELGRVKLRFEYEGWRGGELLARGHTTHGVVDRAWKIARLPAELGDRLRSRTPDAV